MFECDDDEQLCEFAGLSIGSEFAAQPSPLLPPPPPLLSPPAAVAAATAAEEEGPRLELLEWPAERVLDGACILQGGASVGYRFALRLITPQPAAADADAAVLAAQLLVKGERICEDGLTGTEPPVPFDPATGCAAMRVRFVQAGRGALWTLRFLALAQQQELCRLDVPVRTFSKLSKIRTLLASAAVADAAGSLAVAAVKAEPAAERPSLAGLNAQQLWAPVLEEELAAIARASGRPEGLTESDIAFIRECNNSDGAAAHAWVARTLAEAARVPRLWAADSPRLLHFVSRAAAEELLRAAPAGSFLVRWSAGEPGELVVAYRSSGGAVEQVYLRREGEILNETAAVNSILESPLLVAAVDPSMPGSVFPKDIVFRPRARYSRCLQHVVVGPKQPSE